MLNYFLRRVVGTVPVIFMISLFVFLLLQSAPGDPADLIGKVRDGQLFVMIYRTNYWRCAYLIPKGAFDAIKADGLTKFRNRLKSIAGFAADRIDELMPMVLRADLRPSEILELILRQQNRRG